ncbi:hypothetical protein KIN20_004348 [Parelaphostrongylus tenuis]|uniref:Uncharacterized protein n=1 Tax=Parelaphostrongylus tenuis TaxID=148309 RepID=A0AAD5QHZ1_PARTN|nr:hypothetical protein KIN20_004348 [Parelaphostrongylus tenuis]
MVHPPVLPSGDAFARDERVENLQKVEKSCRIILKTFMNREPINSGFDVYCYTTQNLLNATSKILCNGVNVVQY